jgi:hypothetical protein
LTHGLIAGFSAMFNGSCCIDTQVSVQLALRILGQFMEWAQIREHISPDLVEVLFSLAFRGAAEGEERPSIPALERLSVCLTTRCIPPNLERFLLKVSQIMVQLLSLLLAGNFDEFDSDFLAKVANFIETFLRHHLKRIEENPAFSMETFLELFCTFTFMHPGGEGFSASLDAWPVLSNSVLPDGESKSYDRLQLYLPYLQGFAAELSKRIMFTTNAGFLIDIDDSTYDLKGGGDLVYATTDILDEGDGKARQVEEGMC